MTSWNPADYHRHSTQQQAWARELIGKLRLTGAERVLDIGCGAGKVTAEIARAVPRGAVVGVDSSADMVGFAVAAFPRADHPNLRFEVADARELRFDGEFDLVFSNAALHWVIDHRPVLRAICRALKPGGRMLVQMGGAGNAADVLAIADACMADPRWRPLFAGFTFPYGFHRADDYRRWIGEAGLRSVRVELIPKLMTHAGRDGFAAWVRTTWLPYTQRVAEGRRAEFIDDVVRRYLAAHAPDAAGAVHVRMVRLEAEAIRPK